MQGYEVDTELCAQARLCVHVCTHTYTQGAQSSNAQRKQDGIGSRKSESGHKGESGENGGPGVSLLAKWGLALKRSGRQVGKGLSLGHQCQGKRKGALLPGVFFSISV